MHKTFHNGSADRDLLIAKFHVLPDAGWSWTGSAWLDYYTSGEPVKSSGVELTQAFLNASRSWEDGRRLDVTYTHLAIPDIERFEFLRPDPTTLEEARTDRISVDSSRPWGNQRVHGGLGAWTDQEDEGGDAQAGLEFTGWILDQSRTDITAFTTYGRFIGPAQGGAITVDGDDIKLSSITDHQDGSYTLVLTGNPDARVTIKLLGEVIYKGPASKFGEKVYLKNGLTD